MRRANAIPPRLANNLLRRFCAPQWLEEIEGDLEEQFATQAHDEGLLKARLVCWRDVLLLSTRLYLRHQREQHYQQARGPFMLNNYLKIALRTLRRRMGYTAINVTGLAVGMACCMVILLYVQDELAIATLGPDLVAGRTFSPEIASDSAAYLLNEAAVRHFGWVDPLGKHLLGVDGEVWGTVIGVVKNFHTTSFHEDIEPIAFDYNWYRGRQFLIKIDGRDIPEALAHIEQTWTRHRPDFPVNYSFLDQEYAALYRAE